MAEDRYANFDYRSLISWEERLGREWPFFEQIFRHAPSKHLLDLGSGTGEHARMLASKGFAVTGVDSSPAMLEKAREIPAEGVRFVEGDMRDLGALPGDRFGGAICVGNVLPHLQTEDDLARLISGLRQVLLPGAAAVIQLLNYDRIEIKRERALPLTFVPDPNEPGSSVLFLRILDAREGRRMRFMPTVLRVRPGEDPPVELIASERVEVRGWRRDEVEQAFHDGGFASIEVFGSMQRAPFDAAESRDLVLVARAGGQAEVS